jgi:hypothetical protein
MRRFLYSNRPTPPDFMNPVLTGGLPPLRYPGLDEARTALAGGIERFLAGAGSTDLHQHPVFGPIGYEEWHRGHYKHAHHHLLQFGLIETA